ncbi:MAG: hypothetical protein ACK40L_03825 [Hydrogenophaga sp.]
MTSRPGFLRPARSPRPPWLAAGLSALSILLAGCAAPAAETPAPNPAPRAGTGTDQILCPMDAMQCPDGTWVGRQPPACQFVCPAASAPAMR